MNYSRRTFLKFVVAGSIAASYPIDLSLIADATDARPLVDGEHFDLCHQVRDGHSFGAPIPSSRHDIAIIGGGVSGLTAAYLLRDYDFVLLEKEPHWGGNAYLEQYQDDAYSTGAAFTGRGDAASQLAQSIGIAPLPVNDPDSTIINGLYIPDTWRTGLDHLPYPAEVRRGFKKFRDDMLHIDVKRRAKELDAVPLSNFLRDYPSEISRWWDGYGMSNWGGGAAATSALVGLRDFQYIARDGAEDERVTFAGGLGAITRQLAATLRQSHAGRMYSGATIVAVQPERSAVIVTYVQDGALKALAAKAVIIAIPKFIALRVVAGLPDMQRRAMARIPYAPYAVVNLIFDRPVFNQGYDTWCPGNTFTDLIVADWVIRNAPNYRQRHNILTCYTPLPRLRRAQLLTENGCRRLAMNVLRDFQRLMPGTNVEPVAVHLYRRGHPMMISTPAIYTQIIPVARHPMARIFFANTDSQGPVSSTDGAIEAAHCAADDLRRLLAGRATSSRQAFT